MYDYMIQDWSTFTVDSSQTELVQTESDWLSFQPYSDIVFWLEVRGVVVPSGSTAVTIYYETAPAKDESLFKAMASATVDPTATQPIVDSVILSTDPAVPLARWVRWRLAVDGTPAAAWGATFRLYAVANAVGTL